MDRGRIVGVLAAVLALHGASARAEESPTKWFEEGKRAVEQARRLAPIDGPAKNVILFVGDGMGMTTITAARILDGQNRGQTGEENVLSFERLPYSALIKTYNTNRQTADSAGTMTAMMTGVKTKAGVLSVNQKVMRGRHETSEGNELQTLLELAEQKGLSTGIVTNARVTHATPAACYAHCVERDWEDDAMLPAEARNVDATDIARQLIEFPFGDGLDVVLGGGRRHFLPSSAPDPEHEGKTGRRFDQRDLTREWESQKNAVYVWNRDQLRDLDPKPGMRVLGLFDPAHMRYEHDRAGDMAGEPSLKRLGASAKVASVISTK